MLKTPCYEFTQFSSLHNTDSNVVYNSDIVTFVISIVSQHHSTGKKISLISVLRYIHINEDIDITGTWSLTIWRRSHRPVKGWCLYHNVCTLKTNGSYDDHEKYNSICTSRQVSIYFVDCFWCFEIILFDFLVSDICHSYNCHKVFWDFITSNLRRVA